MSEKVGMEIGQIKSVKVTKVCRIIGWSEDRAHCSSE